MHGFIIAATSCGTSLQSTQLMCGYWASKSACTQILNILSMFPSGWIPLVYELLQMYRSSSAMVWEILNSESSMTLSTHFTFNIIRMCVDVHDFHSYLSVNDSTQRRAEFYNFDQLLLFNLVCLATCIHYSIKSAKCHSKWAFRV